MILTVKRKFIAVGPFANSRWAIEDYEATVWEMSTESRTARTLPQPTGVFYYRGLMRCFINGERVDLARFDEALKDVGWDRTKIEEAVR